ncbi:hypothetical protein EV356DRAFT_519331 [Viridothelium virens]|uniref:Uncharacterized protein n=1 Tax=Viridothelium virens TaxID=1048519 RepID=A0A6A6GYW2_VIRVR|nr:hypothetical protein EV356DRAFT_519331 [Viridothelium virens]
MSQATGTSTTRNPLPSKIPRLKHKSSSASDIEATPPYPTVNADGEDDDPTTSLLPPPSFRPFFTLIEDAETGAHFHPAVHYLFADDDPERLTDACLRALDPHAPSSAVHEGEANDEAERGKEGSGGVGKGREERAVILNMASDARSVLSAHSLSPTWQVLGASVEAAPTWEDTGGGGLMLRIEGMEAEKSAAENEAAAKGRGKGRERESEQEERAMKALEEARRAVVDGDVFQGMEELVKRVRKGVEVLEKVVGPEEVEEPGEEVIEEES